MRKQLEIAIFLLSYHEREINFHDLDSGKCYLENDELSPEFFWGASGGFEIIVDGYKSIFKGTEFYVSLEAIDFLLNSISFLKGELASENYDTEFPNSLVFKFQNGNFIKLSKINEEVVSLSYLPADQKIETIRANRFFKDEFLSGNDWLEGVMLALDEYFKVLIKIVQENAAAPQAKILDKYVAEWISLQISK